MTASTRNKLMLSLIIGVIALPAEALLLPVARTPDPAVAAVEWTASLDVSELREAAANIDSYPGIYRRAIMGALTPADRSDAWRTFFRSYKASHPALTSEQLGVLDEAIAMATPEAFALPVRPELKDEIGRVFARANDVLGKEAATELFVTLGPKDVKNTNALPLVQRLADRVRSWRVVSAAADDDDPVYCNCNIEMDTCDLLPDPWLQCSELYTCEFDLTWPMCGPLWSWACTGWCKVIRFPWESGE
jgi:hypothetical protein